VKTTHFTTFDFEIQRDNLIQANNLISVLMKKIILITIAMSILIACNGPAKKKIAYPETKKGDVTDTYFGTVVPDPYRWLEDDKSEEDILNPYLTGRR
jgi:hypothetical protein